MAVLVLDEIGAAKLFPAYPRANRASTFPTGSRKYHAPAMAPRIYYGSLFASRAAIRAARFFSFAAADALLAWARPLAFCALSVAISRRFLLTVSQYSVTSFSCCFCASFQALTAPFALRSIVLPQSEQQSTCWFNGVGLMVVLPQWEQRVTVGSPERRKTDKLAWQSQMHKVRSARNRRTTFYRQVALDLARQSEVLSTDIQADLRISA